MSVLNISLASLSVLLPLSMSLKLPRRAEKNFWKEQNIKAKTSDLWISSQVDSICPVWLIKALSS